MSHRSLLLPLVTAVVFQAAPAQALTIALDAGHGGDQVGAIGPEGLLEKQVTAGIVDQLATTLAAAGHEVILVRPGDRTVPLGDRVREANHSGADLFVSIHCNAVPGRLRDSIRGIETYFLSADATDEAARRLAETENEGVDLAAAGADGPLAAILRDLTVAASHADSGRLARHVQGALIAATGWPDRGVRQAPFAVLNGAAMPAVLVEVGFISHPEEGRLLARHDTWRRLATALRQGIEIFGTQMALREEPFLTSAR